MVGFHPMVKPKQSVFSLFSSPLELRKKEDFRGCEFLFCVLMVSFDFPFNAT